MLRIFLLSLAMVAALLSMPAPAMAQTVSPYTISGSGLAALNKIINSTPGVSTVSVGGSTTFTASGMETVAKGGIRIPVPATITATQSASKVAGLASKALKYGNWLGAASIIIPIIWDQTGLTVCPPPDFFCKPGPPVGSIDPPATPYTWRAYSGSLVATSLPDNCMAQLGTTHPAYSNTYAVMRYPTPTTAECDLYYKSNNARWLVNFTPYTYVGGMTCPAGTTQSGGTCITPGPAIPATEADIATPLTQKMTASPTVQQTVVTAMQQAGISVVDATTPVTISAPPVTMPTVTVSQEQIQNPDGTTSTKTVSESTKITPTVQGNTIGTAAISYPMTTTTTTTTVNNVTNVTNVTTADRAEQGIPEAPEKIELPTDYAREQTLREIAKNTSGEGAPKLPDQSKVVTDATTKADTDLKAARTGLETAHTTTDRSSFFSFFWTPPAGTCAAQSTTVHGWAVSIDPCPTINNIRDVLGWLLALFTGWSIWNLMFKSGD